MKLTLTELIERIPEEITIKEELLKLNTIEEVKEKILDYYDCYTTYYDWDKLKKLKLQLKDLTQLSLWFHGEQDFKAIEDIIDEAVENKKEQIEIIIRLG